MPTYMQRNPGHLLSVSVEPIEVTSSLPEPDPEWRFVDASGHEHHWEDGGWPTLERVVDEVGWCSDCQDEHEEWHWACAVCGEEIRPGMQGPSPYRKFMPGPMTAELELADGRTFFLHREDVERLYAIPQTEWVEYVNNLPAEQLIRVERHSQG